MSRSPVEPTLGEVMDDYLADRRGSVSDATLEADRWAIGHLRPFSGDRRPSEVTPQLVDRFRRKALAEAGALRARIAAGEGPVEERSYVRRGDGVRVRGRQPRRPLGPRSINTLIHTLATLLDVAMERSDVDFGANAARGPRRKIRLVRPALRSFLEVDQVWALLDAASARERRLAQHRSDAYPCRVILSSLTLGGLRIAELLALERGLVNLGLDVIQTSRSKTAAGYREVDVIFAALHQDLAEYIARTTPDGEARDLLVPSANGRRLSPSNVHQRVLAKTVVEANELLRERCVPEIVDCTQHTLRRTYISLLLAAGCDPRLRAAAGRTHRPDADAEDLPTAAQAQAARGVPHARERAARYLAGGASRLAEPAREADTGSISGPNSLSQATLAGVSGFLHNLISHERPANKVLPRKVSDGTRTRDRLDHKHPLSATGDPPQPALQWETRALIGVPRLRHVSVDDLVILVVPDPNPAVGSGRSQRRL
jgi:integrase